MSNENMDPLTLIIGNKNYSSWSLRPWLLLRHLGIPFEEVRLSIFEPDSAATLARWSPSGLVPVLRDGEITVWDSLAICEYLHERFPAQRLWPESVAARAEARSMSAEMHAGFSSLRQAMCMNIRARRAGREWPTDVVREVERIVTLWTGCRERHGRGGEFLFGHFTIADAMYAPVVLRFQTYDVPLDGAARAYAETMLSLPAMKEWVAAAMAETERVARFEPAE